MRSTPALQQCDHHEERRDPYKQCVTLTSPTGRIFFSSSCTNCYYGGQASRCSFYSRAPPRHARAASASASSPARSSGPTHHMQKPLFSITLALGPRTNHMTCLVIPIRWTRRILLALPEHRVMNLNITKAQQTVIGNPMNTIDSQKSQKGRSMPSMQRSLHGYISHRTRHRHRDEQSTTLLFVLPSRLFQAVYFSHQKLTHTFC